MKKLLLGTVVLLSFCAALLIFQISCTKNSEATPPNQGSKDTVWMKEPIGIQQQNKVVYIKEDSQGNTFVWLSNYDGGNKKKLSFSLPNNVTQGIGELRVSPDGKNIFFIGYGDGGGDNGSQYLYKGVIEGNSVTDLVLLDDSSADIYSLFPF